MPTDEEQHWEQEYAEFEECLAHSRPFWRTPAHLLRGTSMFSVFERLCTMFPDHPHDHNTVFYLFEHPGVSPRMYSVVLRCSHFEHDSADDVRALTEFLAFASASISTGASPHLELLDGCRETLHIRFYSPREEIVTLLQNKSSQTAA